VISGLFGDTSHRPYVNGRLLPPSLNLATNISFLVDTAADTSTLMPADGVKLGINYGALSDPIIVGGMGGNANCFQESAIIAFHEPNRDLMRFYSVRITIPEVHPDMMMHPSLLGRDVLDRWRVNYDPSRDSLKFTVRSADLTIS
jgi:hypothetical protein